MTGSGDEYFLTMDRRIEIHQENIKNYKRTWMLALACVILNAVGAIINSFILALDFQNQNFGWGGTYSHISIIALNVFVIAIFSYTMYNTVRLIGMNQASIDYLENK